MRALLDQYVDEGNELRRSIAELVSINVFVRVVYTSVRRFWHWKKFSSLRA